MCLNNTVLLVLGCFLPSCLFFILVDEFNVYTHEAGPGLLSVAIEGPSKAELEIIDRKGFVTVSYIVERCGDSFIIFFCSHLMTNLFAIITNVDISLFQHHTLAVDELHSFLTAWSSGGYYTVYKST